MSVTGRPTLPIALALLSAALTACGGSSDGESVEGPSDVAGDVEGGDALVEVPTIPDGGSPDSAPGGESEDTPVPSGDIGRYGVVALGDEGGFASDALASFARLPTDIDATAFGNALVSGDEVCDVTPSGPADLMDLSVVFVPRPSGIDSKTIEAGETVMLSSAGGGGRPRRPSQGGQ